MNEKSWLAAQRDKLAGSVSWRLEPLRAMLPGAGSDPETQLLRRAMWGLCAVVVMVAAATTWAMQAQLASAVVAPGTVVIDSNSKKVQHPTGGVVGVVLVKNGDKVAAGELLVKLDDTQVKSTLGVIVGQLLQFRGRIARLEAERDTAPAILFTAGFIEESKEARDVAEGERRLFESKRKSSTGQKEQLRERIRQTNEEIVGLNAQLAAKKKDASLAVKELSRVDVLYGKNLVNETRQIQMQRDVARAEGEVGSLIAQVARAKAQISQTELQIISIDQDARTEAQKELREVEGKIAELTERRVAADDQMRRIDIRAPITGIVHEQTVHTIGGVVQAGETMMMIVPVTETLTVEARISPVERDQVRLGMPAVLRFSAFNQRTTPEVSGSVVHIAPDLSKDQQTGGTFYVVRIRIGEEVRRRKPPSTRTSVRCAARTSAR